MKLTSLDWFWIALYFVINGAIGFYYKARAGKNVSEFFLSGRNIPWWLAGTSMVATTFAADTPLAVTGMVAKGAGPSRSAFLSSFFTLVGTHGVHVAGGLLALIYVAAQAIAKGLTDAVLRRLLCWSLFWHALDIVWVGVFTLVYLMGDFH